MKNKIFEYGFLGVKLLAAFLYAAFEVFTLAIGYFIVDFLHSFYEKYDSDKKSDLSNKKQDDILKDINNNYETLKKEQNEHFKKTEKTKKSLALLNKLLSNSEIRQSELLKMTNSSGFYQIFVYSSSLGRLNKELSKKFNFEMQPPKRIYPVFLKDLGFARMGKVSSMFLINRKNIEGKMSTDIRILKKFLMYHFSKIRKKEWQEYLKELKVKNLNAFLSIKNNDYKEYLLINFLLTESNMNITNIGYVDYEKIGLADVRSNEEINKQILLGAEILNNDDLNNLKVKIKKIIDKQDLSLLLKGVEQKYKDLILSNQDDILKKLKIKKILEISNVNENDLINEIIKLNIDEDKSKEISDIVFDTANKFSDALSDLNVNL